jgi:hypothetical protein
MTKEIANIIKDPSLMTDCAEARAIGLAFEDFVGLTAADDTEPVDDPVTVAEAVVELVAPAIALTLATAVVLGAAVRPEVMV